MEIKNLLHHRRWTKIPIIVAFSTVILVFFSSSYLALPFRSKHANAADANSQVIASFPKDFFFGLANAPAQVEDGLDDGWMNFAHQGKIHAFSNHARPSEKLKFFSQPDIELDLASQTGVQVLRMGVDWGRLAPLKPGSIGPDGKVVPEGIQDQLALQQYRSIIKQARAKGMRVMLTLFHHSLPRWCIDDGGWLNTRTADHFIAFSKDAARSFGDLVDEWLTLNESNIFLFMTYVTGDWPHGRKQDYTSLLDFGQYRGAYNIAFDEMVRAHKGAYAALHRYDTIIADKGNSQAANVGIAHFVSQYFAYNVTDIPMAFASRNLKMAVDFPDAIQNQLDFLGLNYYGEEVFKGMTVAFLADRE